MKGNIFPPMNADLSVPEGNLIYVQVLEDFYKHFNWQVIDLGLGSHNVFGFFDFFQNSTHDCDVNQCAYRGIVNNGQSEELQCEPVTKPTTKKEK